MPDKTARLNLRKLRKRTGMSLKELQRKTGIDYSSLHDHETGKAVRVDYRTLARLRKAFRCTWDELFRLEVA